jgi:hypothetical protein
MFAPLRPGTRAVFIEGTARVNGRQLTGALIRAAGATIRTGWATLSAGQDTAGGRQGRGFRDGVSVPVAGRDRATFRGKLERQLGAQGWNAPYYRQPRAGATWVRMLSMTWAL